MSDDKEVKPEGTEGEAPKGGGKKKLIIIIVIVLVLLGGGGGAFMMMGGKDKEAAEEKEEEHAEEEEHYDTAELETIIVNLSENASFLKLKMMLEYNPKVVFGNAHGKDAADEGGGGHGGGGGNELPGELGHKAPMIKDAIIRSLSAKKAADVLSPEGKDALKEELVDAINSASGLDEDAIVAIYFMEFIVQ